MPQDRQKATAAYNFVPLVGVVVASEIQDAPGDTPQEKYKNYLLQHGRLSGHIDLTITAKTPIFIGSGRTRTAPDSNEKEELFFAPDGQPIIPGSTLRGLTKNLCKIITCGAMRGAKDDADFDDKRLYFRSFAEKFYRDRIIDGTEKDEEGQWGSYSKASYGFLIKAEGKYFICPTTGEEINTHNPREVENERAHVEWNDATGEIICYTDKMPKKKRYTIHHRCDFTPADRILIGEDILQSYRDDITRKGIDLLDKNEHNWKHGQEARDFTRESDIDFVAPCFYLTDTAGNVTSFGFGRFYRLPYQESIGEHIPEELKDENIIDYTDAIFGKKELWGSRIAFDDAIPEREPGRERIAFAKTLASPKPTSFQLYLEQEENQPLRHWDTPKAKIRGYKLYWHQKDGFAWRESPADHKENVNPYQIRPVSAGTVFHGRIRFQSLADEELGALLAVFALGKTEGRDICFKLGKGKSIGLGSVKIEARLILTDEEASCSRLFGSDGTWETAEKENDGSTYRRAFEKAFDKHLSQPQARTRFQRMKEALLSLLDFSSTKKPGWEKATRTMTIDQGEDKERKPFQHRAVLPAAVDVLHQAMNRQ
jgi:CRISPR/Cas system CSM-associated protein Csm3 (group 7 of RAMP superfamily)